MMQTTTDHTGQALRRARELAGMSERSAARSLGIRRARLRGWEAGTVALDADELARTIDLYSSDLFEIWPDRRPLVSNDEPGVLVVGDERIDVRDHARLTPEGASDVDNRIVLTRYLAAVRRQRGLSPSDPVELRAHDITSLASVLDLTDGALEAELTELLDLTPAGARWTARALVVGGLMAIGATAVVGGSWLSPAGATTVDAAAPPAAAAVFAPEVAPVTQVSEQASVQFAPTPADPDAPVDAVVVEAATTEAASPFSTEPTTTSVELAPAVFAVAPATEWTPVDTSTTPTPELPPA
jgi:transcriptional regulator with XRE-family HTH domain